MLKLSIFKKRVRFFQMLGSKADNELFTGSLGYIKLMKNLEKPKFSMSLNQPRL